MADHSILPWVTPTPTTQYDGSLLLVSVPERQLRQSVKAKYDRNTPKFHSTRAPSSQGMI